MEHNINSANIFFIGVFKYDVAYFNKHPTSKSYKKDDYHQINKEYLTSKYYPTWLKSVFESTNLQSVPNRLELNIDDTKLIERQVLSLNNGNTLKEYSYKINRINCTLYRENLGIFSIKVNLQSEYSFDSNSGLRHKLIRISK